MSSSWAYVIGKTCRYNCTQIHELDNVFLMPRFGLDAGIAYEVASWTGDAVRAF